MDVIRARGLTRKYGKTIAVDNVSFSIKKGEVFGLLGPNGAGKTTIVSMLSTILCPTSGTAGICGFSLKKEPKKIRERMGIVFQESVVDEELSAFDNIELHARLYGIEKRERQKRVHGLLKLVGLEKEAKHKVSTFSGGMKRKVEVARGLVNNPEILFLDEPTLGLDPIIRRGIWNHIRELKKKGVTIILTTHYMEEADELCDRVGIINRGKFIRIDTPQKLKDMLKGDIISVKTKGSKKKVHELVKSLHFVKDADFFSGYFRIYVDKGERRITKILHFLSEKGIEVKSITMKKPTLEDVFLHFTGEELK